MHWKQNKYQLTWFLKVSWPVSLSVRTAGSRSLGWFGRSACCLTDSAHLDADRQETQQNKTRFTPQHGGLEFSWAGGVWCVYHWLGTSGRLGSSGRRAKLTVKKTRTWLRRGISHHPRCWRQATGQEEQSEAISLLMCHNITSVSLVSNRTRKFWRTSQHGCHLFECFFRKSAHFIVSVIGWSVFEVRKHKQTWRL